MHVISTLLIVSALLVFTLIMLIDRGYQETRSSLTVDVATVLLGWAVLLDWAVCAILLICLRL